MDEVAVEGGWVENRERTEAFHACSSRWTRRSSRATALEDEVEDEEDEDEEEAEEENDEEVVVMVEEEVAARLSADEAFFNGRIIKVGSWYSAICCNSLCNKDIMLTKELPSIMEIEEVGEGPWR